jgi:ribosomal protein L40E
VKRPVIVIFSIVFGWLLGTFFPIALHLVRINIPASIAKTYSQYSTYVGAEVLVFTILFSWVVYQVLARRLLERKVDDRPFLQRLPMWARHPSARGLVIVWVVAVCTVVPYPLAIYMSWRYYAERRDAASKVCPRCAERVRAAALVCRHCGNELDVKVTQPAPATPA